MTDLLRFDFTIQSLAQHYFPNHEDKEDAVQEAYIKLMGSDIPTDNEQGWVYRVVSNLFKDLYSKAKRLRELDQHASIGEAIEENCPLVYAEERSDEDEIGRRLGDLSPDLYAVADYYYFKGWNYQQIANEFSVPVGTVASRLHAARKYLTGE